MRQDRRGRLMGLTSGVALGGICCLGIISLLIASTIVLSLIPLYTPDHSQEWYGERKYKYECVSFEFFWYDFTWHFRLSHQSKSFECSKRRWIIEFY